jgi:hypothetical protein
LLVWPVEMKNFWAKLQSNITLPYKFNITAPMDWSSILMKKMRTIPNLMKDGGAEV